ncbi:MAG: hypothetical protein K8E24_013605 [Methanobacterium paludis]|nr:hypothetical protein [Methanobacterium paludis]
MNECSVCGKENAEYKTDGEYLHDSWPYLCKDHYRMLIDIKEDYKQHYHKIEVVSEEKAIAEAK